MQIKFSISLIKKNDIFQKRLKLKETRYTIQLYQYEVDTNFKGRES